MKTTSKFLLKSSRPFALLFCSCLSLISCTMKTEKMETTEETIAPQANGYALLVGAARTNLPGYSNVFTESAPYNLETLERILLKNDFQEQHITKLDSPKAEAVKKNLQAQLNKLTDKDLFVFYFFGHGDQIPDRGVLDEKEDHKDEVLITADRKLVDDEIYEILTSIKTKARVLFIVDACNSGSSYRLEKNRSLWVTPSSLSSFPDYLETGQENKMALDFLYLGSTQDGSIATASGASTPFTSSIESVLKGQSFEGNYTDYFTILRDKLWEDRISPTFDKSYASTQFLNQQPFKIN